ncbi:cell envelope-related transcriptional attenuator [Sesbania bispinosa]|nr:cell envelope-related transcriptional attenuator [Sesbania bispinosa]
MHPDEKALGIPKAYHDNRTRRGIYSLKPFTLLYKQAQACGAVYYHGNQTRRGIYFLKPFTLLYKELAIELSLCHHNGGLPSVGGPPSSTVVFHRVAPLSLCHNGLPSLPSRHRHDGLPLPCHDLPLHAATFVVAPVRRRRRACCIGFEEKEMAQLWLSVAIGELHGGACDKNRENDRGVVPRLGVIECTMVNPCSGKVGDNCDEGRVGAFTEIGGEKQLTCSGWWLYEQREL